MRVSIGGLSFHGGEGDVRFTVESDGLKGWFESVDVRRQDTDRPSSHGSFRAPTFRTGRVVSLAGLVRTDSPATQEAAMRQVSSLLGNGQEGRLTVEGPLGVTWADVVLNAAPEVRMLAYGTTARYRLEFWAHDPRRYGVLRSFGPGALHTVYHRGDFPAHARYIIPNAAAAYRLTSPVGDFVVSGATAGGTHEVDMRTGRVYRNGTLMPGVSSGVTWAIPPGPGWVQSISTGSMTVQVTDTFI